MDLSPLDRNVIRVLQQMCESFYTHKNLFSGDIVTMVDALHSLCQQEIKTDQDNYFIEMADAFASLENSSQITTGGIVELSCGKTRQK